MIDRNDYSGIVQIPVAELTDDELHSAGTVLTSRLSKQTFSRTPDVSMEAWIAAEAAAMKSATIAQFLAFLESQSAMAVAVRRILSDRDATAADGMIGFIADGGLERDGLAAMIAMREYSAMFNGPQPYSDAVDLLLRFYTRLELAFGSAGIAA